MEQVQSKENVQLMEIRNSGQKIFDVGVSESGMLYLPGDLHPQGSQSALALAKLEQVPYIQINAVSVLYPGPWIAATCDDARRQIIDSIAGYVRSL